MRSAANCCDRQCLPLGESTADVSARMASTVMSPRTSGPSGNRIQELARRSSSRTLRAWVARRRLSARPAMRVGPASQPLSRTDCGRVRGMTRRSPRRLGNAWPGRSCLLPNRRLHTLGPLSDRHEPLRRSARQRMTRPDPFQPGATMMRYMIPIGTLCMFGVGLTIPFGAVVARDRTNPGCLRECGIRSRRCSRGGRPEGGLHQPNYAGRATAAPRQQTSATNRSAIGGGLQSNQPPLRPTKGLAGRRFTTFAAIAAGTNHAE